MRTTYRSAQNFFERRQLAIERERAARIRELKASMKAFVKKYPQIEAVYIIGSLTQPDFYRSESDIDIVVKGLAQDKALKAASFLEKMISAPLDLILWEDVAQDTKTLKKGMKIYEKKR